MKKIPQGFVAAPAPTTERRTIGEWLTDSMVTVVGDAVIAGSTAAGLTAGAIEVAPEIFADTRQDAASVYRAQAQLDRARRRNRLGLTP